METTKKPRGFAAMDPATQAKLASMGGKKAHAIGKAHTFTSEEARAAGAKGNKTKAENKARISEEEDVV